MAKQTVDDDFADDVPDADEVQAQVSAANQRAIVNAPDAASRNTALQYAGGNLIGQSFRNMTGDMSVGDPRVVQAQKIQTAMSQIMQEANVGADPNEAPIDRQLRIATAVSAGMANMSPQIAMKANMQAVALQEAKNQQAQLLANTNRINQVVEDDKVNETLKKQKADYIVYGTAIGKDGLPVYKPFGTTTQLYGPDGTLNKDFATQIQTQLAAARAAGLETPRYSTTDEFENNRVNAALARAQAQAAISDNKALQTKMGLTPEAVANSAVLSIVAPNTVTRLSKEDKEAIQNFYARKGINGTDVAAAQSQMKSLNAAAVAIGTRTGNITNMEQAINARGGLADQVLQTLNGVDRTRFPALNAGIIAGKNAAGSEAESRYHVAMQGLITEYARVISGGVGITTDEARNQAAALLNVAGNPDAVRAAVSQMKDKELQAIKNGSDQAIELIAHPERYGAIMRLQQKAGVAAGAMVGMDPDSPVTYSRETPKTPPSPHGATSAWGPVMKAKPNAVASNTPSREPGDIAP